ncbi:hypothetical protein LguiB_027249 [Lonicera macranthoides]
MFTTIVFVYSHLFRLFTALFIRFSSDSSYLQFVYNTTESPSEEVYDYIVIGGGTAGCPLARTLSANYSVLLLEQGGVAFNDPYVLLKENEIVNLLQADDIDSPA